MKNVSSAFREELKKDNRNYIKSADITLKSGTVLKVDNSDLWQNGMKLDTATSSPNSFDLGAIITGQLTLTLNNIDEKFSDYDFTDCTATNVKVGLKLPDGTTESLSYGKFYLNEAKYNGSIITLTFYDSIYKFDQPYSKSSLSYPATLRQIVQDACSVCGVTLGTVTFDQDDFVVQERPDDSSITFRQVLQWVGQIACYYFYADSQGRLSMKWYDLSAFEDADNIFLEDSDGNFVLDAQEDKIFTFVENGTIYPGTTMPHHNLASFVSLNTGLDDVVITGIKVIQEVDGESGGKEEISYQSGNDGYVLAVSKNKLIQGDSGNTIASLLGTKIIGMRFRTFSASGLSDPTIEAGDPVVLIDRKGNSYQSYITNNVFQPGAYQSTSLGAETPARKSATRYSQMSQVYVDYRKEIEKERTDREEALEELGEQIKGSGGLFTTIETQADGSKKYFMHNKPVLSESDIIWSMTAEAWGVSTDGGKTYNAGMTVDGDTIVRILTAVGVNADWIKTGALRIEKNGQVMLNADIDTGQVDIVANSFSLRGRSIDEIAEQQLSDFVDAVYDPAISNLQSQIDGQIETWFYDYLPTIENAPANSWTTDSEKDKHLGDLFYIVDNEEYGGQAYRWAKIGSEYKWDYVEDTATVKALADAAKAQDTADQKRRVFITTPVPPYDSGDLWMQGASGDIMTCVNSRQSGNYVSTDWEKKNKYTDDTAVTELDQSLGQQGVFNRLTNNGKTKGLYLTEDNELYLNATYIKTGVITDNIGNNYWNLSNGEFRLSPTTTVGNQEIATKNNTISSVDVEYASGTSNTTPPKTGWSTNSPEWQEGRYIWQRTVTTMQDGTQNISDPTCIQGADGENGEAGATGIGVSQIVEQYYLSTSSTTQTGGSWSTNQPAWEKGKYIWTRSEITWTDNSVTHTDPVLAKAINGANEAVDDLDTSLDQQEVFNRLTNNKQTQGIILQNGQLYINASYLNTGIFQVSNAYGTETLYVNVDNGEVRIKATSFSLSDGRTIDTIANNAKNEAIQYTDSRLENFDPSDELTQQEVFNILTNGGTTQGIYLQGGRIYINASYIGSGTLDANRINAKGLSVYNNSGTRTFYIDSSGNVSINASSFMLSGDSIGTIVNESTSGILSDANDYTDTKANSTLNSAKNYTDLKIENFDPDLTQQEVFNILTNNGQTQGIYLSGGRIYINASYIGSGTISASRIAADSITADKLSISDLYTASAKIGGFILGSSGMRSSDNSLRIYGDGRIVFNNKATLTGEGSGLVIRYGMTVYSQSSGGFSDGTGLINFPNLSSNTGGNYIVRVGNLGTLCYRASSSKRYKNHVGELKKEEALKIIDLPVVRFIYKDGYLTETDRNIGREMPGFYAEDVEEISDLLCTYNEDGTVEDWNERTLIPYMLKTIQVQQERIDNLEAQINELKATVSNMKGA